MIYQTNFKKQEGFINTAEGALRKWGCYYITLAKIRADLKRSLSPSKERILNDYFIDYQLNRILSDCTVQNATDVLSIEGYEVVFMPLKEYLELKNEQFDRVFSVIGRYILESQELKASQQMSHFVEIDKKTLEVVYDSLIDSRHTKEGRLEDLRVIRKVFKGK